MIPFGSQRALGQDLATHLLNAHDNEHLEVADMRGSVAQDLHGAFAEWEIQAQCLTRCRNYLYSLSVNPDPAQGELARDQYLDYIDRAEQALGLSGQPRAVIFHSKHGREHCHVVWSRIDAENGKAVHVAFDRQKLMMVTRAFAREHGLTLPDGYNKNRGGKNRQLSLYEMHQQRSSGLTKEQRMEQVTDAWRQSDTPKAFVQALADQGYILATGKRPYVLVDVYGQMNALPKLIDDKTVRTKDIRAFLEKELPPESLPTVEEARELAADYREAFELDQENEQRREAAAELERAQAARRAGLDAKQAELRARQHKDREELARQHRAQRDALRRAWLDEQRAVRQRRYESRPQGLAAFLGRVTGVNLIRKKWQRYQDKRRHQVWLRRRDELRETQQGERRTEQRRHKLQSLDLARQARALDQIDQRERKALEESLQAEQRITARGGRDQMPPILPQIKPQGRQPVFHKARNRPMFSLTEEHDKAQQRRIKPVDLEEDFTRAAEGHQDEGKSRGSGEGGRSPGESKVERARRQRRHRRRDRDSGKER